ncbi:hypothetical protein ACA877_003292 [Vibrio alginolyticus]
MEIQNIAEILVHWGPAGAAAVLLFIGEQKIRQRWEATRGKDKAMSRWLYLGNWVFIAVLLTTLSTVWVINQSKNIVSMSGVVRDIKSGFRVNDSMKELYTKIHVKSLGFQDVHWYYPYSSLPESVEIRIENKSDFNDFEIPLSKVKNLMNIHLRFRNGKLFLESTAGLIELKPVHSASSELKSPEKIISYNSVYFSLFSRANANESEDSDLNLLLNALESQDSYVRQYASQYIVDNINNIIPFIERTLTDNRTSEIINIGIITALARASSSDFNEYRNWRLSINSEKIIFNSAFSQNKILSTQSKRYLIRNIKSDYYNMLNVRCNFKKPRSKTDQEKCAVISLDIIYNLAIKEWSNSINENSTDGTLKGIDILNHGNNIHEYSNSSDKVQFAKLIYGHAFLNHELSKLQSKEISKDSRIKAKHHFEEFIKFIENKDIGEYQYCHHIKQAQCYIEKASQHCFEDFTSDDNLNVDKCTL